MIFSPLVSVIVPSYCHERYVSSCIRSIYDQTYDNIELVVIDDASTDGTVAVLDDLLDSEYKNRFNGVVVLKNHENMGADYTINRGVRASSGQYCSIVNSDDLYSPLRIHQLITAIQENNSRFAFSLVQAFGDTIQPATAESGDRKDGHHAPFMLLPLRQKLEITRWPTTCFALLRSNIAISTGNFLFERSLFDSVGGFLPLKYCHDWDFALQCCFFTEPVVVMEPLYYYRIHAENSFQGLAHRASVESEVVFRRFMRRGLSASSPNRLFPNSENWPGYFEVFLKQIDKLHFLEREYGMGSSGWRIYDKPHDLVLGAPYEHIM